MQSPHKRFLPRYGVALVAVAVAMLARELLEPWLVSHAPFLVFTLAVMVSAWYGGLGPGLVATALGCAAGTLLFLEAHARVPTFHQALEGALFVLVGLSIARLADAWRSARARAEQNARRATEAHQETVATLERIRDGFLALDADWRLTYLNQRAAELFRRPRRELLGRSIWDAFPDSLSRQEFAAELRRAVSAQAPVHCELEAAPDRWFESDAYPSPDGLTVFLRDITERKRLDEQFRQAQKMESLGVLAGGIAHDFNNLLTGIMGNASLALDELPQDSPLQRTLNEVLSASERASNLTRQLLAYAGKGRFVIEPVDLSEAIREAAALVEVSMPAQVELRLELAPDLPRISADAAQMQQLFVNLVLNAAEARAATVRVLTAVRRLEALPPDGFLGGEPLRPGAYVCLRVTDDGCGMDRETQSRIFDPFFSTRFTGRGLGLPAVLGIVRGHRGALRVESRPGAGTTFTVLLPALEATDRPVAQSVPPAGASAQPNCSG